MGQEQHFLAGMGINSISAGDVNKDGRTDLVIANGGVVISDPASGQTATASTEVNTGGITVLLNQVTTGADDGSADDYLAVDDHVWAGVNGSAQVTSSDGSLATGTITFYDGTTNICTIPVAPSASCPASAGANFAVGTHVLTAVYSGDTTHLGSTSRCASYGDGVAGSDADEGADGDDADLECGSGDEWTECDLYRERRGDGGFGCSADGRRYISGWKHSAGDEDAGWVWRCELQYLFAECGESCDYGELWRRRELSWRVCRRC